MTDIRDIAARTVRMMVQFEQSKGTLTDSKCLNIARYIDAVEAYCADYEAYCIHIDALTSKN